MSLLNIQKYNLVKKSAALVNAKFQLSELAVKIISVLIASLRQDDIKFKKYTLNISEFKELSGLSGRSIYENLKKVGEDLMSSPLHFPDEEGGFLMVNWVSSVQYKKGLGVIEFEMTEKLKPYLLELKGDYLSYEIKNILALKSSYIIRLYELCKHEYNKINQYTGHKVVAFDIDLALFRNIFDIPKSYQYKDVRVRILDKAIIQFEEKTDITIKYEEHKLGRKVDKLTFTIRENRKTKDFMDSEKGFIKYMRFYHINEDVWMGKGMVLSISEHGLIYDKRSRKQYSKHEAQEVWTIWYNLAKEGKLPCIKMRQK